MGNDKLAIQAYGMKNILLFVERPLRAFQGTSWFVLSCLLFATPQVALSEKAPLPSSSLEIAEFDHIEANQIFYKIKDTVKSFKTSLTDLFYLGTIRSDEGGAPFFVFTAKPCKTCPDESAVFLIRPEEEKSNPFVYPGRILDPKTKAVLFESRAFFGKCLARKGPGYFVFQKERVDRRRNLQPSVFMAEAAPLHLSERLIERHLPHIKTTLQFVKRKECKEISGRNRLMLRKPLNLRPGQKQDQEDEEDDATDKDDKGDKGEKGDKTEKAE